MLAYLECLKASNETKVNAGLFYTHTQFADEYYHIAKKIDRNFNLGFSGIVENRQIKICKIYMLILYMLRMNTYW